MPLFHELYDRAGEERERRAVECQNGGFAPFYLAVVFGSLALAYTYQTDWPPRELALFQYLHHL